MNLIHQLYDATESQLRSGMQPEKQSKAQDAARQNLLALRTVDEQRDPRWENLVGSIPTTYLFQVKSKDLMEELRRICLLSPENPVQVWAQYLSDRDATEYVVAVDDSRTEGLFHRITGALATEGLSILAAEIHSLPGNIAWDRFLVDDVDFQGTPPAGRIHEVANVIRKAIEIEEPKPPRLRRTWKTHAADESASARLQPTQVRFDNSSSDDFTILTVFAYDRTGLLYDISKTLFDYQIDLQYAKVSTHLDQVVDVFYVTDKSGQKIEEPTRLYTLRQTLLRAIESPG